MPERRPSVLHVVQPTDGGVARCVADLGADQVRRGWRVGVASPPGPLAEQARAGGAGWSCWQASRSPGLRVAWETVALARIVRRFAPDLVHLHSAKAGLAGRLAVGSRRPTVFQPHAWSFEALTGPLRIAATGWERMGARWTDAVLCVSEAERRRGEEARIEARYRVIPNGVDLTRWVAAGPEERGAARERLGLGGDPLAVCVGRLSRQKGQDVLLAAWPHLLRSVPDAKLVLVGEGPERTALERAAGSGVSFAGERHDVADWLAAADVVVSASRWEGLALVLLEAMARGRSVVATDAAGAREALGDECGAIVAVDDVPGLADALAARLLDPALRSSEERAARARAVARFDLNRMLAATVELYGGVLELARVSGSVPPARP